jgi:15-cis-phytoene synthase
VNHNADAIRKAARELEPDRYLAALLAPRAVRDDLIAVAAFASEVGRIPGIVREPMMGEIRLQWWRDALAAGPDTASGHPVADALRRVMTRHGLLRELPAQYIAAQGDVLGREASPDLVATEGSLFTMAWHILVGPGSGPVPAALARAGVAYGAARRVASPPAHETLAGDAQALRAELEVAPRALRTALLPVALIEPYLQAQNRAGVRPGGFVEISPLLRVWRLWRAHRFGRF